MGDRRTRAGASKSQADEELADDITSITGNPTMQSFMNEVRGALKSLNTKLDSVISGQAKLDDKLKEMDGRVKKNALEIANVGKTIDFVSQGCADNKTRIDSVQGAVNTCSADLAAAKAIISSLQDEVHKLQRYTRGFNIRVMGVPETQDENCRDKLHDILKTHFAYEGDIVENAHRTMAAWPRPDAGASQGPRPIIARLHSRATRGMIMRQAREKLRGTNIRFSDDLTATDLAEKRRIQPYMDKLWRENRRPSFRNGRLYAEGRAVSEESINSFLTSEEGKAAIRDAANRRRQGNHARRHADQGAGN